MGLPPKQKVPGFKEIGWLWFHLSWGRDGTHQRTVSFGSDNNYIIARMAQFAWSHFGLGFDFSTDFDDADDFAISLEIDLAWLHIYANFWHDYPIVINGSMRIGEDID